MSGKVNVKFEMLGGAGFSPRLSIASRPTVGSGAFTQAAQASGNLVEATVDSEAEIRLSATFDTPGSLAPLGRPMPSFTQDLAPNPANAKELFRFSNSSSQGHPHHPRFVPTQDVKPVNGASGLLGIFVDCTFLPITDFVRGFGNFSDFDGDLRPKETQFRFYSLTRGAPTAWGVGWRPDLFTAISKELHTLLFVSPTVKNYTEIQDLTKAQLNAMIRYMLSPGKANPHFIRTFDGDLSNVLDKSDFPSTVTNCAFLEQLSQSDLPVLIASPIPHKAVRAPTLPVRTLMISLRRALHADELPAVKELKSDFRIAVGSFSRATVDAVQLLQRNQDDINEFYWFEPNASNGVLTNEGIVKQWITGPPKGRRLRMVGTTRGADCRRFLGELGPTGGSATVFCQPGFRKAATYIGAVAVPRAANPGGNAPPFPERFTPVNQPAPAGSLSAATGIFLVSDNGNAAAPSISLSNAAKTVTVACTHEEAAGKARFGMLNTVNNGSKATNSLDTLVGLINNNIVDGGNGHLHQWAVAGGENPAMDAANRPEAKREGFKGFLRMCLEAGNFPS